MVPLTVQFTDTSTNLPTSWNWTFGDGNTSTLENPSYQYTSPGTYTVTLNATNAGGSNITTQTGLITVLPPSPIANFTATSTSGTVPLTVQFTDTSTNSPTSWNWTLRRWFSCQCNHAEPGAYVCNSWHLHSLAERNQCWWIEHHYPGRLHYGPADTTSGEFHRYTNKW